MSPVIASSEIFPPTFKIYRKDRNRNGGGVLIAVTDNLVSTEEPSLDRPNCEILWVKVKLKGKKDLLIGSYYRSPDSNAESLSEMAESSRCACSTNAIVVLGGDYNFPGWDWEKKVLKKGAPCPRLHQQFRDIIADLGMDQIVEKPTRGDNILDLLVTNHPNIFPRIEIAPDLSDHDIVYSELQLNAARTSQIPRLVPCYGKPDWDGLRTAAQELTNTILSSHSASPNAEAIWAALKSGLDELAEQFIPHKKLGTRKNSPWIDNQTLKLIRRRDRIHKKMKKTGRQDLY
jgi:hypothetical protein